MSSADHRNELKDLQDSHLGKKTAYETHYNPDKLFPVERKAQRQEINILASLPFQGLDIWNHYEVSWLNEKGKPIVATAEISYGCQSPYLIEAKSMKLYFNSFNNTVFKNVETVQETITKDLEQRILAPVSVRITPFPLSKRETFYSVPEGTCLDSLDIDCSVYTVNPAFLQTENEIVSEVVYSDLLKSNCLVTQQPDWGSVQIAYTGKKINHAGLLRYIVSFRNHNEFAEHCVERIFMDITQQCAPKDLMVYGRFTRRGGIDVNPYRTTGNIQLEPKNLRLYRQ